MNEVIVVLLLGQSYIFFLLLLLQKACGGDLSFFRGPVSVDLGVDLGVIKELGVDLGVGR